jgi:hypothetical protein
MAVDPTPPRACGGCTLCCTIMGIKALEKPRNTPCVHCAEGVGCSIYIARPPECAGFFCVWLYNPNLGEHWRPAESGLVLHFDEKASRMEIHVDPARPGAWAEAPFYDEMRAWSAASMPNRGQVIVWENEDLIAILPTRADRLGPMRQDQMLVTHESQGANGLEYEVLIMDQDDPRIAAVLPPHPTPPPRRP